MFQVLVDRGEADGDRNYSPTIDLRVVNRQDALEAARLLWQNGNNKGVYGVLVLGAWAFKGNRPGDRAYGPVFSHTVLYSEGTLKAEPYHHRKQDI